MHVLITMLLALVCFILLIFVIALFVKRELSVVREIVIEKPRTEVFHYIMYLKNQNNFSKWAMMDPDLVLAYKGVDGTVGFESAWESKIKNVGMGVQTISNIEENERMDIDVHFIKPFEGKSKAYFITEVNGENTRVKWGFYNKMSYPMNIMKLFMNMEKLIGSDLQIGLINLKRILEKSPV